MRIAHIDTIGSHLAVDGVATGLWVLATAQAQLDHDVTLYVRSEPDAESKAYAASAGLRLIRMDRSPRSPSLALAPYRMSSRPDMIHFHGAWMTYHAIMSLWLRRIGQPYVVTTHGGYGPEVMRSKRRRRSAYVRLFEAPHLRGAASAITTVAGEDELVHDVAGPDCRVELLPWPADTSPHTLTWEPDFADPCVVFLGRFDVYQKGLDRLVEIARLCPEIGFDLYGTPPIEGSSTLPELLASVPPNVRFHGPVYGPAKQRVLSRAVLYLQPSRFEGFSLSVVDALLAGVPVVASENLGLTSELTAHSAGGSLPPVIAPAAAFLRETVANREQLHTWSQMGPPFARARFDPTRSAIAHLDLYERLLSERPDQRATGRKRRTTSS